MIYRPFGICLLTLLILAAACEKKDPASSSDSQVASQQGASTPTSSTSPPTKTAVPAALSAGETALKMELRSPKAIGQTLETARTLDKWLAANPKAPETSTAKRMSAELKLQAVAAGVGLKTAPSLKVLGGSGSEKRLLEEAIASLSGLKAPETAEWLLAAQSMLASDPSGKEKSIDRQPAMALATSDTDAGLVLRTYWLSRLEDAVVALHSSELGKRVANVALHAGNLLCPACDDAHHATPDMVTSALLMAKNKGGFICDIAYAPMKDVNSTSQIAALSRCGKEMGISPVSEKAVYWGANLLVAGTLVMAKDLVNPTVPETGPIAPALAKRNAAVKQLLEQPVILPTPQVTGQLPKSGSRLESDVPAAIEGLGFDGQTSTAPSLTVFQVGPNHVSGFIRPTVKLVDGAVHSVSLDADSPSDDVTFEVLKTAPLNADTGSVADIKAIAERKLDGAKALTPLPKPADKETADMIVDSLAPSWAVTRTLDSLRATGFAHFRFLRTAIHGQGLPLVVRAPEKELVERLNVGYERAAIAHVTAQHVDVWLPSKLTTAQVPTKNKTKLPKGVNAGYKGKTLVRLRIDIPQGMGHGLDDAALNRVQEATAYAFAKTGAGRLLHVTAAEDALAADVLRVARIFQEISGKKLTGDQAIWPSSACAQTGIANSGKSKCPSGVAVAFSKETVPSSRGVTSEPNETKKKEAKKPEPPKAKKTAFCDRKSISAKMRRRTAAFRFCYEKALRMQKGLSGRVKVRFTIGASGALVGSPSVVSATLKNSGVHKCLVKNVSRVKFDPPKSGTCTVSWPFNFKSND